MQIFANSRMRLSVNQTTIFGQTPLNPHAKIQKESFLRNTFCKKTLGRHAQHPSDDCDQSIRDKNHYLIPIVIELMLFPNNDS